MLTLIAIIPILLCVILMTVFGWPAKRAMPLSWACAALIAGIFWKMKPLLIASQTIAGFLGRHMEG